MQNFHPNGNCPIRDVLSRLGDKWSMLVLITLHTNGTMRFSDIHKTIADVSQRMLTVTLRTLESDGLVKRKGSFGRGRGTREATTSTIRANSVMNSKRPAHIWKM